MLVFLRGDGEFRPPGAGVRSPAAEGDDAGALGEANALSAPDARRYARHYLALAGLPLPPGARLVRAVDTSCTYECDTAVAAVASDGMCRLLQVRIDPRDASLAFLLNRPFPPISRGNRGGKSHK